MTDNANRSDLYGGNGNRAVAFVLDGMLVAFLASLLSSLAPGSVLMPVIALLYFSVSPLTPLQATLGKWICRIRLCDRSGTVLGWRASVIRAGALTGWFCLPPLLSMIRWSSGEAGIPFVRELGNIVWLIILLPWATIGFRPRRESMFDLLAGTLVVRSRTLSDQVAADRTDQPLRWATGVGVLLLCLSVGATLQVALDAFKERTLRARVAYAINETRPLQTRIEDFHEQQRRWPTMTDLGLPTQVDYPDGGHYRLGADGTIWVTFSVLPELKGYSLRFRPIVEAEKPLRWICQADGGLNPRYLPSRCK